MPRHPTLTKKELRTALLLGLGKQCVNSICHFCEKEQPKLWGENRDDEFITNACLVALYKDLRHIGYSRLSIQVRQWFPLTFKSLQHNQRALRKCWKEWAKKRIILGSAEDHAQAARRLKLKAPVTGVTAWVDSVDFPMQGVRRVRLLL